MSLFRVGDIVRCVKDGSFIKPGMIGRAFD